MKFLHCLVVLVVLSLTCCYGDKEHDDDYIDPFDMVNFDPVTKTMKNKVPLPWIMRTSKGQYKV